MTDLSRLDDLKRASDLVASTHPALGKRLNDLAHELRAAMSADLLVVVEGGEIIGGTTHKPERFRPRRAATLQTWRTLLTAIETGRGDLPPTVTTKKGARAALTRLRVVADEHLHERLGFVIERDCRAALTDGRWCIEYRADKHRRVVTKCSRSESTV